jgi:hypothetical protein
MARGITQAMPHRAATMLGMETSSESTKTLRQRAEENFAARLAALDPLERMLAERAELRRQLAETDKAYGEAYAAAEKAGWTEDQLAELGAESPTVRPPRPRGRPRKSAAKPSVPRPSAGYTDDAAGTAPAAGGVGADAPTAAAL